MSPFPAPQLVNSKEWRRLEIAAFSAEPFYTSTESVLWKSFSCRNFGLLIIDKNKTNKKHQDQELVVVVVVVGEGGGGGGGRVLEVCVVLE